MFPVQPEVLNDNYEMCDCSQTSGQFAADDEEGGGVAGRGEHLMCGGRGGGGAGGGEHLMYGGRGGGGGQGEVST